MAVRGLGYRFIFPLASILSQTRSTADFSRRLTPLIPSPRRARIFPHACTRKQPRDWPRRKACWSSHAGSIRVQLLQRHQPLRPQDQRLDDAHDPRADAVRPVVDGLLGRAGRHHPPLRRRQRRRRRRWPTRSLADSRTGRHITAVTAVTARSCHGCHGTHGPRRKPSLASPRRRADDAAAGLPERPRASPARRVVTAVTARRCHGCHGPPLSRCPRASACEARRTVREYAVKLPDRSPHGARPSASIPPRPRPLDSFSSSAFASAARRVVIVAGGGGRGGWECVWGKVGA